MRARLLVVWLLAACTDEATRHRQTGSALARAGRHRQAVREYGRALRESPDDAVTLTLLANSEFELGRIDAAERHYEAALAARADYADAHFGLGMLLSRRQKGARAAAHFEKVLRQNPRDLTVLLNLGRIYLAEGDVERAEERLEAARALDDDNVDGLYLHGQVAVRAGELDRAQARFRELERLAPDRPYGLYGRAAVEARRGRKDEALRLLGEAIGKGIDDVGAIRGDWMMEPLRDDPRLRALAGN